LPGGLHRENALVIRTQAVPRVAEPTHVALTSIPFGVTVTAA
jgi:hypothetical protein